MSDRSIDLFDVEQANDKHETSHVHAYVRGCSDRTYTVFVARYRDLGDGVRGYALSAVTGFEVERFARYSAKRIAQIAADESVIAKARALAGIA